MLKVTQRVGVAGIDKDFSEWERAAIRCVHWLVCHGVVFSIRHSIELVPAPLGGLTEQLGRLQVVDVGAIPITRSIFVLTHKNSWNRSAKKESPL